MATANDVLTDSFDRISENVQRVVGRLSDEQLAARVAPGANTVAWLVWHLTRVMDDHVAAPRATSRCGPGTAGRRRSPCPSTTARPATGSTDEDVASVRVAAELLLGYHQAVQAYVHGVVDTLTEEDLDRIVDRRWDPPVTLAVRLVSVVDDATQHAGQADYVAGILETQ